MTLSRTGLGDKQWIHAVDALKSTKVASFYTSSNITTFAIVHAHEDIPSIETQGLEIVSDAYLIQGNTLSISIWLFVDQLNRPCARFQHRSMKVVLFIR